MFKLEHASLRTQNEKVNIMTIDADLEMILADLGGEYLDRCEHDLDVMDDLVSQISDRIGIHDHHVMDIKRILRAIKTGASGYNFITLAHIAHAFEDYIDLADSQSRLPVDDCRLFVDGMRYVIIKRGLLDEKQQSNILEGLPLPGCGEGRRGLKVRGHIVFMLPKSVQQKIISRELASIGFRITNVTDMVQAIDFSLHLKPDLVITGMDIARGSGLELASSLASFSALAHTKIAVLTGLEVQQVRSIDAPPNTTLIERGSSFPAQLIKFVRAAGFA
jgi:hypothetical protein